MFTTDRTMNALLKRLVAANWQTISITMKCNGDVVTITPCSAIETETVTDPSQIDWYLVDSPSTTLLGGSSLRVLAEQLNRYEELVESTETDKKALQDMREKLENPDDGMTLGQWEVLYESYSDYSKDVYGYRDRTIQRPARFGGWDNPERMNAAREEYDRLQAEWEAQQANETVA